MNGHTVGILNVQVSLVPSSFLECCQFLFYVCVGGVCVCWDIQKCMVYTYAGDQNRVSDPLELDFHVVVSLLCGLGTKPGLL